MPNTTNPLSTPTQPPAGGMDPGVWYPVLESNPEVTTPRLPGWMWIELQGKPRNVWAAHFEVHEGPESSPTP